MKKKLSLIVWTLLVVPLNLAVAGNAALPAPLPEFMNQQQLAQWSAREASKANATGTADTPFYTGKPYVADIDGYICKYRTYNPEMSRWTSADPGGFPDGVNNQIFPSNRVSQLDRQGLSITLSPSGNPTTSTAQNTDQNGVVYTVTANPIIVDLVTDDDIDTLNNLYGGGFSAGTPANIQITVNTYFATLSGPNGLGLVINLSAPVGYDFTQDVVDTRTNNGNPPGIDFADNHPPGTSISSNASTPGGHATEGDLTVGAGNWYDTPGWVTLDPTAVGEWNANLFIEQVSGNNYTVVGEISYSYTISE